MKMSDIKVTTRYDIKEITRYECSDGKLFETLKEAREHQFEIIVKEKLKFIFEESNWDFDEYLDDIIQMVWETRVEVVLAMTSSSYSSKTGR